MEKDPSKYFSTNKEFLKLNKNILKKDINKIISHSKIIFSLKDKIKNYIQNYSYTVACEIVESHPNVPATEILNLEVWDKYLLKNPKSSVLDIVNF